MPKEDLDNAIAHAISSALLAQKSELGAIIQTAVKEAVDSILTPQMTELTRQIQDAKNSVSELTKDLQSSHKTIQSNTAKFDTLQLTVRANKSAVNGLQQQVGELTSKITQMEDRSRRSNVRLIGLKEGEEGSDAIGFLRSSLPKWIPSLRGRDIRIERAHRLYSRVNSGKDTNRPRTLIFKLLDYCDRQAVLKGSRAQQVKHDGHPLLFFPD